ncbi:MAG: hypothetical protein EOP06_01580, partial [Proteobacteria bacterium]
MGHGGFIMKTFGLVTLAAKGKVHYGEKFSRSQIIVDAEPHVMSTARKIFPHGQSVLLAGKFTHKVLLLPINHSNAKDVIWLSSRYPLEFAPEAEQYLISMADSYDALLKTVSEADKDPETHYTPEAVIPSVPLREHQNQFVNMANLVSRMLLADVMGLGKTISALGTLAESTARPAIVVCPPHLCHQWQREVLRVYPNFKTHVIQGYKTYALPDVDVIVTSYNRLAPWQDVLYEKPFATVLFDEVHELRKKDTAKREYARLLSIKAKRAFGLSGTPIFNYGIELWSVIDSIYPDSLGAESDFASEWCVDGKVREPAVLNAYLKARGLMLRRTPEETGLHFGSASKHVYTLDADLDSLKQLENVMKTLALSIVSARVGESDVAAREFDYKLRMATGVAKAKPVAQFVRMICEQGEKVLLAGFHRDVYEIWNKELSDFNPVMVTGSESAVQKAASVKKFIEDDNCKVIILSHKSGSGIDGLQFVCRNVVFGELDWSPHVMDQIVMRVDRDGQRSHPQAYYMTVNDGSDPFIMNIITGKRSQHDGIIEGKSAEASVIEGQSYDPTRVLEMAKAYLKNIGEEIPEAVEETGALADVANLLRSVKVPTSSEAELQEALDPVLRARLSHT